jgi:DNA/RNA-binding domain of Phe-tRNA-synthetase-like protein
MIEVAPIFKGVARLGILQIRGLQVMESSDELKAMLNGLAEEYARKYAQTALGQIPALRSVRAIFHRAGLDPTRYRPSSESLLRRAVKGKGLYFINSVVDLVNYYSLKLLSPMGLYDADRLKPPIVWRVGVEGESYEGIGRDRLTLTNFPLLADPEGPFGSPISDSMRTRVTELCTNILWITFGPPGGELPLQECAETMMQFNGGTVQTSTQYDT